MELKVKKLHPDAILPTYATPGSACFDLYVCGIDDSVGNLAHVFLSREYCSEHIFKTGLAFELPKDHVMLVFSRSGHGFKENVRLANCVGVVDQDFVGEVKVKLTVDHGGKIFISDGDRIAQAMVIPVEQVTFKEVSELSETVRGENGFGSSGA